MDYIVTGGAGYIGGHVTDYLISKGHDVTVIDNLSSGHYINRKSHFIKFDLKNEFTKKLKLKNPRIIHLAANPDVKASMSDLKGHYDSNVTATLNTLKLARKIDASSIVFSSTSAVYGDAKTIPTPESCELNPISNYALFKVMDEVMLKYYAENYGIRSVALRFANATGGRANHGIVYNFATCAKSHRSIEIWGDGKQMKSYIYISDLINGILAAESKSKKMFDTFNLGNKDSCTVVDIVKIFKKCAPGTKSKRMAPQAGDVRMMQLSIKKIAALGWKPKYTSKEAIKKACVDLLAKYK